MTAPASSLAALAADFSPRYQSHGADLVIIDVSGLGRLLGDAAAIGGELRRAARDRGLAAQIAVAATQTTAMVLARVRPGLTIVPRGEEAVFLAPVPLDVLTSRGAPPPRACQTSPTLGLERRLSASREGAGAALSTIKSWGLRTLGELAALPPADLASRLGPSAPVWQALARGEDRRPLVPDVEEERFESSLELEWPIEGLEPLSFVLTRLLEPLSTRLERRDRGAAVLHVRLDLAGVADACHSRRLDLPSPMRDVRTLRTLALLDLEAHPPGAAIDAVTVTIEPTPGRIVQHALFDRPQPSPDRIATLLARVGAVMGQDRVGAPVAVDSHAPGAFGMRAFQGASAVSASAISAVSAISASTVSALKRYRHPLPARVAVSGGRPVRLAIDRRGAPSGAIVAAAGPWRATGNWWASHQSPERESLRSSAGVGEVWQTRGGGAPREVEDAGSAERSCYSHDEWDVALADGSAYRLFQDRDTDRWFVEGMVD